MGLRVETFTSAGMDTKIFFCLCPLLAVGIFFLYIYGPYCPTLKVNGPTRTSCGFSAFALAQQRKENTLLRDLKEVGFEIIDEKGTSVEDEVDDVFQYITVRR